MPPCRSLAGIDGSHYDWDRGPMDLAAAVRDGIQFFTHKATEGGSYVDPQFAFAMARAFNAGMPLIGAYCVNRRGDQAPQVDRFIRTLDQGAPFWRDRPFLVQLDCERWSDKDGVYAYEPRIYEIHSWCDIFMQRTGGRLVPVVYAPKWVYGDAGLRGLRYPLWASSYGSNPAVPYRQAYPGDGSSRWGAYSGIVPAILQFGSTTTIGAQSICDANAFRGSLSDLMSLVTGVDDMNVDQDAKLTALYQAYFFGGASCGDVRKPDNGHPESNSAVAKLDHIGEKIETLAAPAPAAVDPAALKAAVLAAVTEALADPQVLAAIATAVADEDHRRTAE